MADLFDLPPARKTKEADKFVVNKSTNKKSASTVIKGGGIIGRIAEIKAKVSDLLGKYENEYDYFMQDTESAFKDYIYNCKYIGRCSIDTETTGLNPIRNKIVGLSLHSKNQKGVYVPLNHKSHITNLKIEGQLDPRLVSEQLKILVDNKVQFGYYNAAFDIRVLKNNLRIYIPAWFDAHLAAMCLNENEPHGLKNLHSKYVLDGKEDEFSFGDLFENITFDLVPIKTGYIYAARDAVDTTELIDFQLPYLDPNNELCKEYELEGVSKVFWNIEMPYVDVIVNMEDNGISVDTEYAKELSVKYHKIEQEKLQNFYNLVDGYKDDIDKYKKQHPNNKLSDPINVASPQQLAILFYDILKVPVIDKKSPRGTGAEILEKIDNPLCKAITEYRGVSKLLSTYIDVIPELKEEDGKVHCKFNQYGAKTGRLSSDSPNMQNIPSHNTDIRKMFMASEGCVMLSADFSQQEPRVMTAMCQDPQMIEAYKNNKDLYASIASLAFNKSYEDCLEFYPDGTTNKEGKGRRSSAKSILLGILYGRGLNSVAEQLNVTRDKAQEIQDKVFKGFPAIKKFEDDTIEMAKCDGFVTTFWGRKRRLPEMQFDEYEFSWIKGHGDLDPLSFNNEIVETEIPQSVKSDYIRKLRNNRFDSEKRSKILEEAKSNGIKIVDNGGKIADATRQCVNSRIQGSAADMSKIAGRIIYDNQRLKELGFKLLIPIHDEYLAECPKENAKECAKIFSDCMCSAAEDLGIPIKCDVSCSERWYGDEINL